jgi:ribonuclease P protein component
MRLKPLRSLTKRREFDLVFKEGSSLASKNLVIYARPNELDFSRLGLAVSKKIGKAVARNRIKRLLREAMRTMSGDIPLHYDFVFVARKLSADSGMDDFMRDIKRFLSRLTNEKHSDIADKSI